MKRFLIFEGESGHGLCFESSADSLEDAFLRTKELLRSRYCPDYVKIFDHKTDLVYTIFKGCKIRVRKIAYGEPLNETFIKLLPKLF